MKQAISTREVGSKPSTIPDIPGVRGFSIQGKLFCLQADPFVLPAVCSLLISSGSSNISKSLSEARICFLGMFQNISEEAALITAVMQEQDSDMSWYPDIMIPSDSECSVNYSDVSQAFRQLLRGLRSLISTHSLLAFHLNAEADIETVGKIVSYVHEHTEVSSFPDWELDDQDRAELQHMNELLRLSRQRSEILARRLQEFRVRERSYDQRILCLAEEMIQDTELTAEFRIKIYEKLENFLGALKQ